MARVVGCRLQIRLIPIVADSYVGDRASVPAPLKLSPAHDPNDFGVGLRLGSRVIGLWTMARYERKRLSA